MSDSFVPLVTSAQNPATANSFQLKVVPSVGAKPVFEALPPAAPAPAPPCGQPTVTLQRTGDTISGIRIQCTCGQVIELQCAY